MSTTPADATSDPHPSQDAGAASDAPMRIVAKRSAKVQFTQTMLLLEAFVVLFATLTLYALRDVPGVGAPLQPPSGAAIWIFGGSLAIVLVVLSRMMGSSSGYLAGSIVQVPVLALGLWVPMMLIAGGIFMVLWVAAVQVGGRVDRERAEYDAAHPDTAPNVG